MKDSQATTGYLNVNLPDEKKKNAGEQLRHYSLFTIEVKKVRQWGTASALQEIRR